MRCKALSGCDSVVRLAGLALLDHSDNPASRALICFQVRSVYSDVSSLSKSHCDSIVSGVDVAHVHRVTADMLLQSGSRTVLPVADRYRGTEQVPKVDSGCRRSMLVTGRVRAGMELSGFSQKTAWQTGSIRSFSGCPASHSITGKLLRGWGLWTELQ